MRAIFLVVLLGCSDPQPPFADAPVSGDAAIDAAVDAPAAPDAPDGNNVTVHVRRRLGDGMPDTAASVYLAAPDGTLRATVTPDASGVARLDVTAGDSVTVRAGGPVLELSTVGGVEPGDELWFGPPGLILGGQMTLGLPVNPNAVGYRVFGPCMVPAASDVAAVQVQWWTGCPDTRTLIAVADTKGGVEQMFTATVTMAPGGTADLAGTWVDAVEVAVPLTGAAPGIEAEAVFMIGGELVIGLDATAIESPPSLRWRRPATLDEGVFVHVIHGGGAQDDLQRLAPGAASVDVTARVPAITGLVETPALSWTVAAPDPIDAFYIETVGSSMTWVFVLPPDARTLVRPQIPDVPPTTFEDLMVVDVAGADYDDFRPQAGHRERFVNRHPPAGYDLQFRTASQ